MFDKKDKWMLKVVAMWLCITFTKEQPLPWCRLDRPWCLDNMGNTEALILNLSERAPVFSSAQLRTFASLIPYRSGFMTIVCVTVSFNWCVCFAAPKFLKERKKKNQSGMYKCSQRLLYLHSDSLILRENSCALTAVWRTKDDHNTNAYAQTHSYTHTHKKITHPVHNGL